MQTYLLEPERHVKSSCRVPMLLHYLETPHCLGLTQLRCTLSNLPPGPDKADGSGEPPSLSSLILALAWCFNSETVSYYHCFLYSSHWLLSHFYDENFDVRLSHCVKTLY